MTRFARVDMYAVAPLMPSDKTAGRVAARGEHFEWEPSNPDKLHSKDPIPTRAPTNRERMLPEFVDLTGKRVGRFTVTGIADIRTTNGQNWSVRCVCGAYETRKAKTIKACLAGTGDPELMCDSCGYTRRLQQGYFNPKKAAAAAEAIMEAAR